MNIFSGFETLDLLDFDAMLWASPDNIISNPHGDCIVSGDVAGFLLSLAATPGQVESSGSCEFAGSVNYIYISGADGETVASGSVSEISMHIYIVGAFADIAISGNASVLGIAIVSGAIVSVSVFGNAESAASLSILSEARLVYECAISGDGYDDLIVPISAFTSRQRAGDPSYSEVIIPGMDSVTGILDRQMGIMTVSVLLVKSGVVMQREILFESEIASVSITGNTNNQQIMLSGYRTSEAASIPAVVPVSGVNYRLTDNGTMTLRKPEPDLYLRPGDTVQYDGDEFTVALITFSFSAIYGSSMEIKGE